MKTKLVVVHFIETSHQNKAFFNQKFYPKFIGNLKGRKPTNNRGFAESNENFQIRLDKWYEYDGYVCLDDWVGKERNDWIEFRNVAADRIEFYSKTYKINGVELPYPQTVDHFITDCYRLNVSLVWRSDLIDQGMKVYDLVTGEVSKEFVNELLVIMDKL